MAKIILLLLKLLRHPADHLERHIALVSVLVLFIGIDQCKVAGFQGCSFLPRSPGRPGTRSHKSCALDHISHVHYNPITNLAIGLISSTYGMKDVCVVDPNFVICWYYNQYVKKTTTPLKIQNRRMDTFIKGVNEIIVAKMKDEGFGVSELAKEMNISRTTLHRKIKSGTGQSVSQLIRDTRLKRALELLENEPLTVAEAAYMTGFRSATYFSKCFRKKFDTLPSKR